MRNALLCFLAALCVSVNSELSPWPSLRLLASEKTEAWQLLATGWARITPKDVTSTPNQQEWTKNDTPLRRFSGKSLAVSMVTGCWVQAVSVKLIRNLPAT